MKTYFPATPTRRRLSVLAKVVVLTSLLLGAFLLAQLYTVFDLNRVNHVVQEQSAAVRQQNRILADQSRSLAELKLIRDIAARTDDLRYWYTDLSLSLQMEAEKMAQAAQQELNKLLAELAQSDSAFAEAIRPQIGSYIKSMQASVDAYSDGNRARGNSLAAEGRKKSGDLSQQLTERLTAAESKAVGAAQRVQASATTSEAASVKVIAANQIITRVAVVVLIVVLVIGSAALVYLSRSVFRPFNAIITMLGIASEQTQIGAAQISSASRSLAEGASEQATSLEETSASLEEISSMTQRNSHNAQSAKELTTQTRTAAESGVWSIREMGRSMQDIRTATGELCDGMNGIRAASNDVSKIIKTIDEIAFQTNILALNAAVEAARAGEAGMGFAVVADEVRNLAQRSAKAAKETADMIEASIKRSEDGVRMTEKVTEAVQDVTERSKQLEEKLSEILARAQQVDEQVAQIASASQEQSQGIGEVNLAVGQMDKVTQSNAAGAEESAGAAEKLYSQAAVLKNTVVSLQHLVRGGAQAAREHRVELSATATTVRSLAANRKPLTHKLDNQNTAPAQAVASQKPAARKPVNIPRDTDIPMPEPIGDGSARNRLVRF